MDCFIIQFSMLCRRNAFVLLALLNMRIKSRNKNKNNTNIQKQPTKDSIQLKHKNIKIKISERLFNKISKINISMVIIHENKCKAILFFEIRASGRLLRYLLVLNIFR